MTLRFNSLSTAAHSLAQADRSHAVVDIKRAKSALNVHASAAANAAIAAVYQRVYQLIKSSLKYAYQDCSMPRVSVERISALSIDATMTGHAAATDPAAFSVPRVKYANRARARLNTAVLCIQHEDVGVGKQSSLDWQLRTSEDIRVIRRARGEVR
jgi:hypothetical protein